MAEYINMITASAVVATLFLGGWTLGGLEGWQGWPFIWFVLKVAFFLFVFIWLRATLPRIRYDQLMRFGWQVLLPLAVLNLLVTALAIASDWPWWVTGLFGLGIILIGAMISFTRLRSPRGQRPVSKVDDTLGLELPASVRLVKIEATAPDADSERAGALN
jgi:NADH-quinone oxidoreductase subunit H